MKFRIFISAKVVFELFYISSLWLNLIIMLILTITHMFEMKMYLFYHF